MAFNQRSNTDDIHIRSVLVGLLNLLNNQIFFENVVSDEKYDIVEVPFFPPIPGEERFLQDYFMLWDDCGFPKTVDGNIDVIPRGHVNIEDITIDTSGLTQRWVRGEFTKNIGGRIETFSAYINSLPLDLSFSVEIHCNNTIESYKIIQAFLETFYKVRIYNIAFKGFMVPCQVSFPEDMPLEKSIEFTYPSDSRDNYIINFSLDIETYYPVVDEPNLGSQAGRDIADGDGNITRTKLTSAQFDSLLKRKRGMKEFDDDQTSIMRDNMSGKTASIRHKSNIMENIIDTKTVLDEKDIKEIKITNPVYDNKFKSLETIEINWEFKGWIDKINLYYSEDYGNSWILINKYINTYNKKYLWNIPNFSKPIDTNIISNKKPIEHAEIKLLADINGSIYDYIIVNPGKGYDETAYIEIESKEGDGAEITLEIDDSFIKSLVIHSGGSNYKPTKQIEISLKIQSSSDNSLYDILKDQNENVGVITIV